MKLIQEYLQKFDQLTARERALILVTTLVALLLPLVMYVLEPAQKKQLKTTTDIAKLKAANANKQLDIQTLHSQAQKDPNEALKAQIAQRQKQLDDLNAELRGQSEQLISPSVMLVSLQQIVSNHQGVELVSVNKSEPVAMSLAAEGDQAISASKTQEPAGSIPQGLYRHDLEVVINGGFFDVLNYLKSLEQLPKGFFWDAVDYQVTEYPQAQVSIKVHTLSMDRGWLGV
ncbi:MAG: hypothetical protein OQJ91_01050 [Motiliproteus sp.]|nr:hypothetical protein [Motiliproteus sp.]